MTNGTNTTTLYLLSNTTSGNFAMPSKYECITQEINSSRSQRSVSTGKMIKHRITTKKQITVEWNVLTKAEKNTILSVVSNNTFALSYFDPETDTYKTGTFYRGSDFKIAPLIKFKQTSVSPATYEFEYYTMSMSLIEV